MGNVGVTHYK